MEIYIWKQEKTDKDGVVGKADFLDCLISTLELSATWFCCLWNFLPVDLSILFLCELCDFFLFSYGKWLIFLGRLWKCLCLELRFCFSGEDLLGLLQISHLKYGHSVLLQTANPFQGWLYKFPGEVPPEAPQTSRSYHPFPCCPFRVLGLFPHSAYLESIALGQGRQVWVGVPNRLLTLVGFHTLLHELYDLAAVETGTWGRRRPRRLYFPGFLLSLHFGLCRFFFFCAS